MSAPLPAADFSATPMAESRRTIANRINAQKSTGPRTEEGKERSRRNAVKHGMAGSGKCVPMDIIEEARRKTEEWSGSLKPKDEMERDLVELGATAMTMVRRCWREMAAARGRAASRAERVWETDRRADVAKKAGGLAKRPMRVAAELRKSRHGAEWMAEQWRELGVRLEAGQAWTEPQRSLALDLLGVPPEFRDGFTRVDFPNLDPQAADAARRRFVARQVEMLESEIEGELIDLDDEDRALRVDDLAILGDPDVERLRRYERTLSHRVLTVTAHFRRGPLAPDETKPNSPPTDPAPRAVTLDTRTISAMQVAPSLVPPPAEPREVTPDEDGAWLSSRSDTDIELTLLPLMMARLAEMHREQAERLKREADES